MARRKVSDLDKQIAALKAKADEVGVTIVREFSSSDESKQDKVLAMLQQEPRTKGYLKAQVDSTEKGIDSFISYIRNGRVGAGTSNDDERVNNCWGVNREGKGLNAVYKLTEYPDRMPYFYSDEEKENWISIVAEKLGVDPTELI